MIPFEGRQAPTKTLFEILIALGLGSVIGWLVPFLLFYFHKGVPL